MDLKYDYTVQPPTRPPVTDPLIRVNLFTEEAVPVTAIQGLVYDRIMTLGEQFAADPPFTTDPRFVEWDRLRMEFIALWPKEYRRLLD